MVAKITTPLSINRALNYNEQKVQKGSAECLYAGNFLHTANELNFYQKLTRFQGLIEQNASKTNTLHISLNFHPSENLLKEKLIQIADTYMNKIGFGEQPYLVYQHFDAGHPHLHIVTTNIRENGKRIDTYNIGKNQSQKARKEIEAVYGLMRAEDQLKKKKENGEAPQVQKARYGVTETKKGITNVLNFVIKQYKYTSLAQLNAILKLYQVIADRGCEESRTFKNRGLHYRLLDEKGNKVGVPIKASSVYFKPTLNYLEEKFTQNESLRLPFKSKLKTAINWTLSKKPNSINELVFELKKEKITAVVHQNEKGFIYGITYIDHYNKTIFNGSDLGKEYGAAAIKQRILKTVSETKTYPHNLLEKASILPIVFENRTEKKSQSEEIIQDSNHKHLDPHTGKKELLELLTNKEGKDSRVPFDFIRKKKKRRKPR